MHDNFSRLSSSFELAMTAELRSEDTFFTGLASIWSKYIYKFQLEKDLFIAVYCIYPNFKHFLTGSFECVALSRGYPCMNVSLMFVFSGSF